MTDITYIRVYKRWLSVIDVPGTEECIRGVDPNVCHRVLRIGIPERQRWNSAIFFRVCIEMVHGSLCALADLMFGVEWFSDPEAK